MDADLFDKTLTKAAVATVFNSAQDGDGGEGDTEMTFREFQVAVVNEELSDTKMRLGGLQRMAQLTGGSVLSLSDFGNLNELLDTQALTTTVRSERPLWDNGWIAALLIILLGMEWFMRRKYDLT